VLVGVNGEIMEFDRTGAIGLIKPGHAMLLDDVFSGASGFAGGAFDPHILYDPNSQLFVVVAVDQDSTAKTSHILVAVSNNATPHSGADFHAVSIDATAAVTGGGSWADFPQVGLDQGGHLYITANMFTFAGGAYAGTRLWIVGEASLTATTNGADPAAGSGAGANDLFSLAPTYMPSAAGNFLVSYNSATNGAGDNVVHVVHVDAAGHFGGEQTIDVGAIDQSGQFAGLQAPQPGVSKTIDADDSRASLAVYQNGHLYFAASIIPSSGPDRGDITAHWWQLDADTTNGVVGLHAQGDVSGNTFVAGSNLRTYYPSVAVGDDGAGHDELAIGFSSSAPQTGAGYDGYPSAYEVTFNPATGVVGPWHLLASGQTNYYRTFGTHDNRWGDYSSITTDPTNHGQYWAFNEYAAPHGVSFMGENGIWGTELGLFA
jgi:hypothetical protein